MELSVTVTGKWKPEKNTKFGTLPKGWICKSSNPDLNTDRHPTYEEAFDIFVSVLILKWSKTFENYPQLFICGPILRGKSYNFVGTEGGFLLDLDMEEASISWIITLRRPVNRTLDEFEPLPAKSILEKALPELERLGEEEGFTVSLHKAGEAA
jgi:hypothetical protein